MDISIIICTCNRAKSLRATLESIGRVCVPEDLSCELIVVDNASTDSTMQDMESYSLSNMPLRYIYEPRRGKGYAYNAALAEARGKIFLFTDDDVRPRQNWIEGMCAPILSGEAHAVAGGITLASHLRRPWLTRQQTFWLCSTEHYPLDAQIELIGANMAFSREVLHKVPGFDPEIGPGAIGHADDTLFSWQLREAGYKIISALDVVVEHHPSEDRLYRPSFVRLARKCGEWNAYVDYHWHHKTPTYPYLRLLRAHLRLWRQQVSHIHECFVKETLPDWEMMRVEEIHYFKQYLVERKRPRNYEKHGLVKIRSPLPKIDVTR